MAKEKEVILCPMTFSDPENACKCIKEKCAWWCNLSDTEDGDCAITCMFWFKAIATSLRGLSK